MNSLLLSNKISTIKCLVIVFTTLFINACADTKVVTLEESVAQINNLIDYDKDGVVKAREKCDFTVTGASIDNYGCGSQISKIAPFKIDIKFAHNSYIIPSFAYAEIKNLAEFLDKYQELNILIEGHTSNVGTAEFNQRLSENRAQAIAFVLVNDFNINKQRVSSIGYGFNRLEKVGDTEEAHFINRRIIAELSHIDNIDVLEWTIYTVDEAN
jgi:outer membrane protein OmpA-like peptidoglycan-associated protein